MRNEKRGIHASFWVLLATLCLLPTAYCFSQTEIKFATLAPDNTSWMKACRAMDKAVQARSAGAVKFKFYPGGVMGDEGDVLRKMRFGQVHAGGFTGLGLGSIAGEVRALEIPGNFRNYKEVDAALASAGPDIEAAFQKAGYTLLGWAEVGFAYLYTNKKVAGLADMGGVKMWMWEGDVLAAATFDALKIRPVPMNVPDVLTSLQTGLIDAVYGSPLAITAVQWQTKVKFVLDAKLAYVSGGVVVSNKILEKVSPENRKILMEEAKKAMADITAKSREENAGALEAMKKQGIQVIPANPADLAALDAAGLEVRKKLSAKGIFPLALAEKISKAAATARGH